MDTSGSPPVDPYATDFPNLTRLGFTRTSEPDVYNCIAFAAGDTERWWWPNDNPLEQNYWPSGVPNAATVEAFVQAFETLNYTRCDDGNFEAGYEKIAIYRLGNEVTHAARQQANGAWKSKLGPQEDIEHTLDGLEGPAYGTVVAFLKRPIT